VAINRDQQPVMVFCVFTDLFMSGPVGNFIDSFRYHGELDRDSAIIARLLLLYFVLCYSRIIMANQRKQNDPIQVSDGFNRVFDNLRGKYVRLLRKDGQQRWLTFGIFRQRFCVGI